MYTYKYPRPALTVDIVVFTLRANSLQVLLIQRAGEPYRGKWALPGGFVHIEEDLETAARRELEEETGLFDAYLEQFHTFGAPQRDPRGRVVTIAYYALIPAKAPIWSAGGSDAAQARWFPICDLPKLAFDHDKIIEYGLKRLRHTLANTAVAFELHPVEFPLSEIQRTYEIILGEKLDDRKFLQRILSVGVIEEVTAIPTGKGRSARRYRFRQDAVMEIKSRQLIP